MRVKKEKNRMLRKKEKEFNLYWVQGWGKL